MQLRFTILTGVRIMVFTDCESDRIVEIFKKHGILIESGEKYSIKGQIAQLLNGCKELLSSRTSGRYHLCPWCGEEPEISVKNNIGMIIQCVNSDCPVESKATAWSEREAIRIWNDRSGFEKMVKLFEGRE